MARRQLNREQKQALIREQLRETPEKSDRQIAAGLGVSDKTVGTQRKEMERTAEIPQLPTSIGADGKERPRQVERRPAVEPARETPVMMEPETPTPFVRRGTEVYPGTGYAESAYPVRAACV